MLNNYHFNIVNPDLANIGYIIGVANINDKHDRSAPSDYHWKVLKCRMIIFSTSSILACPDKKDLKQVHIIFNRIGEDYDKLNSLFLKYSLLQAGAIRTTTPEIFQMCFQYTMTAKIAPTWNNIGFNYFINNRDFLTSNGLQEGIKYHISSNDALTLLELKPIKINFIRSNENFLPGELIRVLPSLNKANIEKYCDTLPEGGHFNSYKDLRRHWKNIHGYRLPEEEGTYYMVQFWRGDPLTYPKICVTGDYPIITPMPKSAEKIVLTRFLSCLKSKFSHILGMPLTIQEDISEKYVQQVTDSAMVSQAVSLCTCMPTQASRKDGHT